MAPVKKKLKMVWNNSNLSLRFCKLLINFFKRWQIYLSTCDKIWRLLSPITCLIIDKNEEASVRLTSRNHCPHPQLSNQRALFNKIPRLLPMAVRVSYAKPRLLKQITANIVATGVDSRWKDYYKNDYGLFR